MTPATPALQGNLAGLAQWRAATVGSLLADAVRHWPAGVALQWPTGEGLATLTWQQVWWRATAGATLLRRCSDISAPVAIWAPNSRGWYLSLWAVALSGRPLVPINPALTAAEVRVVLSDSGASTVLAARSYRGRDLLQVARELKADLPVLSEVWDVEWWCSAQESGARVPDPDDPSVDASQPSDAYVIQYTSGTTGAPKGAVLSHRTCVNAAGTILTALELTDHPICCSPLPLHHIGALVAHALALACTGGTYVMLGSFSAPEFLDAAAHSRATHLAGVPTAYLRLLDSPRLAHTPLPDVRVLMLGGASIPATLVSRLERHFGAAVSVMYGQSEAPAITTCRLDDPAWVKANTVGRALPHREMRIIDTVTGAPADPGGIGEICVRTPIRMDHYNNLPDATAAAIDAEGWLHTGDLGFVDADGLLHFHGRLRDMIVRGGENIYAREVEIAIETHPDVAQAAVVGLADPRWGEVIAAAVIPRAGTTICEDDLRAWITPRLAPYKRPTRWHFPDELPTTASGKPQKFKIVDALASAHGT